LIRRVCVNDSAPALVPIRTWFFPEFKEFEYRLPLGGVSHFSIDGDLRLNKVHWGGTVVTVIRVENDHAWIRSGKYYPVPYESGISSGFDVGKKLYLFATPEKKVAQSQ
jgi:hypothetical protein